MNEQVKRILRKNSVRSQADITILANAFISMTHLKDLNNLTKDLFEKYLNCCWLSEYDANSLIVKQYQKAKCFYIVVDGSLLCTYKSKENLPTISICTIQKGMSFGQLPLQAKTVHSCSLVSITDVQLLIISSENFNEIFNKTFIPIKSLNLSINDGTVILSDQVKFLQNLELFKSWPINFLLNESDALKLHVYERNKIIEKSAHSSKYIYIVTNGRASVWTHFTNNKKKDGLLKYSNKLFGVSIIESNELLEKHHIQFCNEHSFSVYADGCGSENFHKFQAKLKLKEKFDYLSGLKITRCVNKKEKNKKKSVKWAPISTIYYYLMKKNKSYFGNTITINTNKPEKQKLQPIKSKLNVENQHQSEEKVSVLMQQLHRGEQYGLHALLFDSQPEMELLSDGCECILISKEVFIRNSGYHYLRTLHESLLPFPPVEDLQSSYELHYKRSKIREDDFLDDTTIFPRLITGF